MTNAYYNFLPGSNNNTEVCINMTISDIIGDITEQISQSNGSVYCSNTNKKCWHVCNEGYTHADGSDEVEMKCTNEGCNISNCQGKWNNELIKNYYLSIMIRCSEPHAVKLQKIFIQIIVFI